MRAALGEQPGGAVVIHFAAGERQCCDRVETGSFEGVKAPVEDALFFVSGGPLNGYFFHHLFFGCLPRTGDTPTSPERGMSGTWKTRRIVCP